MLVSVQDVDAVAMEARCGPHSSEPVVSCHVSAWN